MDLHKRLSAMSPEHHKALKLCQRSERITSSPSLLSWPSSLSLPSWLSSQVPPPQRPSSSTSLLSLLSLPSSPSWPSLPSSPSSPSWPSWEPFWEVRTVESGSKERKLERLRSSRRSCIQFLPSLSAPLMYPDTTLVSISLKQAIVQRRVDQTLLDMEH